MRLLARIYLLFILSGCDVGIELIEVPKDAILHDNGSKVWLIDEILNSKKNFSTSKMEDKSVLIFYNSYKCVMQPLASMGKKEEGKKGYFELLNGNTQLMLIFNKEKWIFNVKKLNALEIILEPLSNSQFPYELNIKTFPEI